MTDAKPNILFIHVDELRFPMHFPSNIETPEAFMETFMPNVHNNLWQGGVVFSRHYTAAADCSAGRGTFVTGLYAHQTNLMIVRGTSLAGQSPVEPPALRHVFPTYGKLLQACGYDTPYYGKWHLSDAPVTDPHSYLKDYGFEGKTIPDPNGVAGQGIGQGVSPSGEKLIGDHEIALDAIGWLTKRAQSGDTKPFCLTVGFINPHDKQWFWSGPEGQTFGSAFTNLNVKPFSNDMELCFGSKFPAEPGVNIPGEDDPKPHQPYVYPIPPNWQSKAEMNQPGYPTLVPVFSALTDFTCGGISDSKEMEKFTSQPSILCDGWNAVLAPHRYWTRALDMYTQAMFNVDKEIGLLLDSIPPEFQKNLVVVFTSDHGEYASSHGLQGKGFSGYEETMNVPLIVRDYTGRFTQAEDQMREQVTSHVDLLPMLVSFGYGDWSWMTGDYAALYGNRLNLLELLINPGAPGRLFAAYTCDEVLLPKAINPHAPDHVVALMFPQGKLTLFYHWKFGHAPILAESYYYDRTTPQGLLEMQSSPSPYDPAQVQAWIAGEVDAALPLGYLPAQALALAEYWAFRGVVNLAAEAAVKLSEVNTGVCPLSSLPVYIPTVNAPQAFD